MTLLLFYVTKLLSKVTGYSLKWPSYFLMWPFLFSIKVILKSSHWEWPALKCPTWLDESMGWLKKCKKFWANSMAFHTEKCQREKKFIFQPRMLIQKEIFKSKPKNGLKKAYFWCTLIHASQIKCKSNWFFLTKCSPYNKTFTPWKSTPSYFTTSWDKGGGGLKAHFLK